MGPTLRHWIKVAIPETNSAIDTKNPVVSRSNFSAPAIISGGVMMATKMAKRCCKAAKRVSRKGGGLLIRKSTPVAFGLGLLLKLLFPYRQTILWEKKLL